MSATGRGRTTHPLGASDRRPQVVAMVVLGLVLPLAGLVFLLRPGFAALHWTSGQLHFSVFLLVGATAASLSLVTGEAARRRGDARVLLLSLAFLATGGFMALHAIGTKGVLVEAPPPGFTIAVSAGLLVAAPFAFGSALVDLRPDLGARVVHARRRLQAAVLGALALWSLWTVQEWPPLQQVSAEGGNNTALKVAAGLGAALYASAALRLWWVHRHCFGLLVFSIVACYGLLAEALVGVALAGERTWHPAWWTWHGLIVVGFALVFAAAHHQWRDERFRALYLPATREHRGEVSVLVGDLAGFTSFAETRDPAEVAAMLRAYYAVVTPLIARRFGGEVEKFAGDGVFATFNRGGNQPDHAHRAVRAAIELQREVARVRDHHPDWPGLRVGVNSGPVVFSEMGGTGYVAYPAVGDTVNVAARLQARSPVGGVLIGEGTRSGLPEDVPLTRLPDLVLKGKGTAVAAWLVRTPTRPAPTVRSFLLPPLPE